MGLILAALYGLAVGTLARFFYPGPNPMSHFRTMLLGLGGGFLAGFIGRVFGWYAPGRGAGIAASVLAAMAIIYVGKRWERPRQV